MDLRKAITSFWKNIDLSDFGWTTDDTIGQQNSRSEITTPDAISRWLGHEMAEELLPKAAHLTLLTPEDLKAATDVAAAKLESYKLKLTVEYETLQREFDEAVELYNQMELPDDFRKKLAEKQNKKGKTLWTLHESPTTKISA